jgi:hypothetical protein
MMDDLRVGGGGGEGGSCRRHAVGAAASWRRRVGPRLEASV